MLHSKAKISDLDFAILEEDVSRLEVAVDYSAGLHVVVSIDDLVHESHSFRLGQCAFSGDELGKVAAITEFCDDIGVIFCVIDVIDLEDVVAVLERFEDLYF